MVNWLHQDITPEEEKAVAAFMARLAATPVGDAHVPSADVVWWKARLLARWDAESKAQRPLDVMEPAVTIVRFLIAQARSRWL